MARNQKKKNKMKKKRNHKGAAKDMNTKKKNYQRDAEIAEDEILEGISCEFKQGEVFYLARPCLIKIDKIPETDGALSLQIRPCVDKNRVYQDEYEEENLNQKYLADADSIQSDHGDLMEKNVAQEECRHTSSKKSYDIDFEKYVNDMVYEDDDFQDTFYWQNIGERRPRKTFKFDHQWKGLKPEICANYFQHQRSHFNVCRSKNVASYDAKNVPVQDEKSFRYECFGQRGKQKSPLNYSERTSKPVTNVERKTPHESRGIRDWNVHTRVSYQENDHHHRVTEDDVQKLLNKLRTLKKSFETSWREDFLRGYVGKIETLENRVQAMLVCPQLERIFLQHFENILSEFEENPVLPLHHLTEIYTRLETAFKLTEKSELSWSHLEEIDIFKTRESYRLKRADFLAGHPEFTHMVKSIDQVEEEALNAKLNSERRNRIRVFQPSSTHLESSQIYANRSFVHSNDGKPYTTASLVHSNDGKPYTAASLVHSNDGKPYTAASFLHSNDGKPNTTASAAQCFIDNQKTSKFANDMPFTSINEQAKEEFVLPGIRDFISQAQRIVKPRYYKLFDPLNDNHEMTKSQMVEVAQYSGTSAVTDNLTAGTNDPLLTSPISPGTITSNPSSYTRYKCTARPPVCNLPAPIYAHNIFDSRICLPDVCPVNGKTLEAPTKKKMVKTKELNRQIFEQPNLGSGRECDLFEASKKLNSPAFSSPIYDTELFSENNRFKEDINSRNSFIGESTAADVTGVNNNNAPNTMRITWDVSATVNRRSSEKKKTNYSQGSNLQCSPQHISGDVARFFHHYEHLYNTQQVVRDPKTFSLPHPADSSVATTRTFTTDMEKHEPIKHEPKSHASPVEIDGFFGMLPVTFLQEESITEDKESPVTSKKCDDQRGKSQASRPSRRDFSNGGRRSKRSARSHKKRDGKINKKPSREKTHPYKILTRGKTLEDFIQETGQDQFPLSPKCKATQSAHSMDEYCQRRPVNPSSQHHTTSSSLSIRYVSNRVSDKSSNTKDQHTSSPHETVIEACAEDKVTSKDKDLFKMIQKETKKKIQHILDSKENLSVDKKEKDPSEKRSSSETAAYNEGRDKDESNADETNDSQVEQIKDQSSERQPLLSIWRTNLWKKKKRTTDVIEKEGHNTATHRNKEPTFDRLLRLKSSLARRISSVKRSDSFPTGDTSVISEPPIQLSESACSNTIAYKPFHNSHSSKRTFHKRKRGIFNRGYISDDNIGKHQPFDKHTFFGHKTDKPAAQTSAALHKSDEMKRALDAMYAPQLQPNDFNAIRDKLKQLRLFRYGAEKSDRQLSCERRMRLQPPGTEFKEVFKLDTKH